MKQSSSTDKSDSATDGQLPVYKVFSQYIYRPSKHSLVQIYLAMIRPIIEFRDVIYDSCSLATGQAIESIQRQKALICTGLIFSIYYASVELSTTNNSKRDKIINF